MAAEYKWTVVRLEGITFNQSHPPHQSRRNHPMSQSNVLVLVGSLRAGSVNRQLAETAVSAAPEGAALTIFEGLADVPFYNEDLDVEGASIPAVDALRAAAGNADAFLLVTPSTTAPFPPYSRTPSTGSRVRTAQVLSPASRLQSSAHRPAATVRSGPTTTPSRLSASPAATCSAIPLWLSPARSTSSAPRTHVKTLRLSHRCPRLSQTW